MDMIKIYDIKANKADINTVTKTIDEIHKQVQQLSQVNVSTIKNLLLESKNSDSLETKVKNRTILLNQTNILNSMICGFKISDAHVNNKFERESDNLKNFKDFNENSLKEVSKLLNNLKDTSLQNGNKGFSKRQKSIDMINESNSDLIRTKKKLNNMMHDNKKVNMTLPSIK